MFRAQHLRCHCRYQLLVYTTQLNSAFCALWLVNPEVISKNYSPPSNRCERFSNFQYLVTQKLTFWSANYSACVVYTTTIIHLSVGESDGYLPPLRWIPVISIYTLSDLGVLSNLIGSLSLANEHYSPPTEWIMRKPNKNKMAGVNLRFASVSESIFNGFLLKILLNLGE